MKKIIFATGNEGKMKEIRMILADLGVEILSQKEAQIFADIVEDGTTFEANAVIKAKGILNACKAKGMTDVVVLADDSGLEVDYMDKAPGVYSARFLGENTSYDIKNQYIIDQLADAVGAQRSARFACVIAAAFENGQVETRYATIEGEIGYESKGTNGFGYDPIFYVPEYGCTTAELSSEVKNEISHRGKALEMMKPALKLWIESV